MLSYSLCTCGLLRFIKRLHLSITISAQEDVMHWQNFALLISNSGSADGYVCWKHLLANSVTNPPN